MTDTTHHGDGGLVLSALDSPAVLEERLTLVGAALETSIRLGTFTDEELAALDDLTTTPAQPSPWFASLSDDEKQIALTAALRGLTARGVFRAEPVDPDDRTYTALVEPSLAAMLTMRRFVPHLLVAERSTAEFVDWAVFYPQRAGVFLAEYVDRRGLHAFEIAGTEHTVGTLAQWVGSFDSTRPDLDVTLAREEIAEQPEVLRAVTETLVATTLTRVAPETMQDTSWSALYTGPAGSYAATTADDAVRYQGIDTDDITNHLRKALG